MSNAVSSRLCLQIIYDFYSQAGVLLIGSAKETYHLKNDSYLTQREDIRRFYCGNKYMTPDEIHQLNGCRAFLGVGS